jgi:hypothetical protein
MSRPEAAPPQAEAVSENFRNFPIGADRLNEEGVNLNEQQLIAIEVLVAGRPLGEAAQTAGVTARTLYNWRHRDKAFARELKRRHRDVWDERIDRFRALLDPAIDMLEEQITSRYDRNRYQAAATILRLANVRSVIPVKFEEDEEEDDGIAT